MNLITLKEVNLISNQNFSNDEEPDGNQDVNDPTDRIISLCGQSCKVIE